MTQFDRAKFKKTMALSKGGATKGERSAAKAAAARIAKAAGLTMEQAGVFANMPTQAERAGPSFADIFNTPEMIARQRQREIERQAKCAALLKEYGTEEAVFAPCALERALKQACEPLRVRKQATGWRVGSLLGWEAYTRDMPAQVATALRIAIPFPTTLEAVWSEYAYWEKKTADRYAFDPACDPPDYMAGRQKLLEDMLNSAPEPTFRGLLARISWMEHLNDRGFTRDLELDVELVAALRRDVETMSAGHAEAVRSPNLGSSQ